MPAEEDRPTPPGAFQSFIDSVRVEAIERADAEAHRILTAADEQSRKTISDAKAEAERIVEAARADAARFETTARESLERAARDVLLEVEAAVVAQLRVALTREVTEVMCGQNLSDLIDKLVGNWHERDHAELEVLLSPADVETLESLSRDALARQLAAGVTVKGSSQVNSGLRIGVVDGHVHYDFTCETVAEWLSQFVAPRVRAVLREAAREAKTKT